MRWPWKPSEQEERDRRVAEELVKELIMKAQMLEDRTKQIHTMRERHA